MHQNSEWDAVLWLFSEGSEYGDAAVEENSASAWVWPRCLSYSTKSQIWRGVGAISNLIGGGAHMSSGPQKPAHDVIWNNHNRPG